jgi:hypothetical protein
VIADELLVEGGDGLAQLGGRAHGSKRVVLVQRREPEDGHDRIADELLHRAAVPLEHAPQRVEVAALDAAPGLEIEALGERRRVHDVAKEHADGTAARRRARRDVHTARV